MALSIIQSPQALIAAYQPIVFIIESDSVATQLRIAASITAMDGDMLQADSSKRAKFNLAEYTQRLITIYGQTSNIPVIYSNVPKLITFDFVEWSGIPISNTFDLTEVGPYYLLNAYIPVSRSVSFYQTYASLLAYLVSSKSALTWWPDEQKKVFPATKEFINFLQVSSADAITITLSLKLYFTDGTNSTSVAFTVADVDYMKLVYLPTGYTELGIEVLMSSAFPDKTLDYYSCTVKTGSTAISKEYKYVVDTNYYEHPRELHILNAFGFYEIFVCRGKGDKINELKSEIAITDGISIPDKLNWRVTRAQTVKVNTGHLTSAQLQWLSDMDFKEAFEMIGSVKHAIVFKDMEFNVSHDNEFLFNAELEYEYAFTQKTENE